VTTWDRTGKLNLLVMNDKTTMRYTFHRMVVVADVVVVVVDPVFVERLLKYSQHLRSFRLYSNKYLERVL
jgi:hypothetical protein